MELTKSAGEQLLSNILPVVDNFERALKSMSTAKDVAALKEGVDLIYANFKSFLTQNGVKEIETENADFNTGYSRGGNDNSGSDSGVKG